MHYGFIVAQQHRRCGRLDYRSIRLRPGECANGIHRIPQRLNDIFDLRAILPRYQ